MADANPPNPTMADRVRGHDWSATPLGPMDRWPQSLRTAVSICLSSRFPMFVWWGPQLINIYNDSYATILGKRHPEALGRSAPTIWHEIWDVVGPQADAVMRRGEATWNERVLLVMERQGYTEHTWFTWSYSPIIDESGGIGGVFCACVEETAHVKAEAELRESQRRYQALASAGANVLYRMSADWSEMRALAGQGFLSDTSQPSRSWMDEYVHPEDQPKVAAAIAHAIARRDVFELEHRVRRADGAFGWTLSRAVPLLDDDGNIVEWIGAASDITARRESEEAIRDLARQLEQQSRQFEQIASTTPDFIYVFDLNWRFRYANRRLLEVWGRTWDEAIGRSLAELGYPAWHVEKHHHELQQVLETKKPIKGEVPFTGGSGISGVYEYIFSPVLGPDGEVEVIAGTTRDVTDLVTAREARRESEQRLRLTADAIPALIAYVDARQVYRFANAAYLQWFGLSPANVIGRPLQEVVGESAYGQRQRQILQALAGESVTFECPMPHVTRGLRDTETSYVPDLADDGTVRGFVVLVYDITARKEAERERERLFDAERVARSEAERASRMKDEFLATLSHELRTPLNAIFGWSQILTRTDRSPAEVSEGLKVIERNARAQTQIIEDLLEMSRIISGKVRLTVQPVDLPAIVDAAIDTVRPAADAKGVQLSAVLDQHDGTISGDAGRLQQVFWNLLSNAVKFTPGGGQVRVRLQHVDGHVEISVTDTGEGIRPEFVPHVFDRFRQADASTTRRHGGLGLGLAIVKQLVELHGGTVRVRSDGPAKGSVFTVCLPVGGARSMLEPDSTGAGGGSEAAASRPRSAPQVAGIRVVVVDDEADARSMIRRLLENSGAVVRAAASAAEAVQLLAEETPDVLVSDIGMPQEDGYSLIRRLRALPAGQGGRVPAVALTAYARTEDRVRVLQAGYQAHVIKPVEPAELLGAIAALVVSVPKS